MLTLGPGLGLGNGDARHDLRAGNLGHELGRALQGEERTHLVHAALEAIAGFARQGQPAGGLADGAGPKHGAFQQHFGAAGLHLGVGPAHDPGQGHRLFAVANQQVAGGKLALLAVQGDDGLALGGMNLLFYMSLRTVPLGIAVALEFIGPLAVAMFSSRRIVDFLWIGLVIIGLALFLPLNQSVDGVDPVGACYALGAGVFWALYIIFGQKAGANYGTRSVALGALVATAVAFPIGVAYAGASMFSLAILPVAIGVAILSTALPYSLEMVALTRLPAKTFGTLTSLEPAMGALSGLIFLNETLSFMQWAGLGAVIIASMGASMTIKPKGKLESVAAGEGNAA